MKKDSVTLSTKTLYWSNFCSYFAVTENLIYVLNTSVTGILCALFSHISRFSFWLLPQKINVSTSWNIKHLKNNTAIRYVNTNKLDVIYYVT